MCGIELLNDKSLDKRSVRKYRVKETIICSIEVSSLYLDLDSQLSAGR